jgi:ABC-type transport system involved in multi-copper enzyme maturation permease subunit
VLRHVFAFELRYHLRSALFWLGCALFFLIVFGAVTSDFVQVGGAIGNVNRNSPFVVLTFLGFVSVAGVFVSTAFVAGSILRDYDLRTHEILFTTRVTRFAYVWGRFLGSYAAAIALTTVVVPAIIIGSAMPWLEPERIGPFLWQPYVYGFLVIVVPNILIMSALFFGLATLTRSLMYTYVGLVALFVGYGIAGSFAGELEKEGLATLLDPFGQAAIGLITKYWTTVERNTLVPGLAGPIVRNRLLWTGVSLLILLLTYWRFSFSLSPRRSHRARPAAAPEPPPLHTGLEMPATLRRFDFGARVRQFAHVTRMESSRIVRSAPFLIILAMGVLNVIGVAATLDEQRGTATYPVTHLMLSAVQGAYLLFAFIILVLYSAELIWRDRSLNYAEVNDALPVRDGVLWGARLTSLCLVVLLMLLVGTLAGIGFQAWNGYYNFEIGLYVKGVLFEIGIPFLQIAVLALLAQVLTSNRYAGFLVMLLYFISFPILQAIDLDHRLYWYANSPGTAYSDMNGYGHYVQPTFWFYTYWTFAALLLMAVIHLFWPRGRDTDLRSRRRVARQRFTPRVAAFMAAAALAMLATGGWIFYNTNVLNDYVTGDARLDRLSDYEKQYKQYETLPQPKITAVYAEVDIFPERRSAAIRGRYTLRNKTTQPIPRLHVLLDPRVQVHTLDIANATLEQHDSVHGYRVFRLAEPLSPAAELTLAFELERAERGFVNSNANDDLTYNGTFFNNLSNFPHIGYQSALEMQDPNERRRRDLPPIERMPKLEDDSARINNYISSESDWIDFETIVSTSADQIAIAPGYLQQEYERDGRRYFHYKMDAPILGFFSYLSARYTVARDRWNDVAIEIYYDAKHPYNVQRMIDAVKKSLDYFTTAFGPYQHRQVRIIEFPRYAAFAQSFPNTIPYSESIGFIARIEDPDDIDFVFYVTAHEVAHQWWAHQVVGGNVQGATVTSETMSQYSALMVMEKEYGAPLMRRFLKYELDNYLRGRGGELIEELPLLRVENQAYIHYSKGSLVTYALRDYLGEARLNSALEGYVARVRFQEPPYTTSLELLNAIRAAAPEHAALLDDLFERIVLYDHRAAEATAERLPDGRYRVRLAIESRKYQAAGDGTETEVPVDDWIDVGVFAAPEPGRTELGKPLLLEKRRIQHTTSVIEVVVDEEPARAGLDPYNKLIDRNPDNNTITVSTTGG